MSETASVINYMNTGGGGRISVRRQSLSRDADRNGVRLLCDERHRPRPYSQRGQLDLRRQQRRRIQLHGQRADVRLTTACAARATRSTPSTSPLRATTIFRWCVFQNCGGADLELFAASGTKSTFDSTFRLVGDTANGGLSVQSTPFTGTGNSSAFVSAVKTNVQSGHAGGEQHLVVHADRLRCVRPGVAAELDAQDAV